MGVAMLLEATASSMPDRVLIGPRHSGTTAAELAALAGGGAAVLAETKADSLGFVGMSGKAFPVSLFAAVWAGMPFTPLNYRLSAEQLSKLAGRIGRRPFLIVDDDYLPAVRTDTGVLMTTSEWLAAAAAAEPLPSREVAENQPAVVLYTSGTTSDPKGAVLRHEHLVSYVLQTVEFGSADAEDAALISVPPYHVAGVGTVLTNTFAARRMVHLAQFDPSGWLETVRNEGITQAMVVPTMLARVVEYLDGVPADVPMLRSIAYGGARMPRPVLEQALALFPEVAFTNAYGLTETSSTIAVLSPDDHWAAVTSADPAERERLASAGRLIPGVEGQIRGESGEQLPAGGVGELWVRGGQVSGEYLGSGSVLDSEGWFCTRDRAYFDAGGYLFISGRVDDTIIRGGENIAPAEIEDVLVDHPAVKEVAVVGIPDDEWGARIVAVVVPAREVDGAELREHVRRHLRGSRTPDEVAFRAELPRTPTGKVIRRELVGDLAADPTP